MPIQTMNAKALCAHFGVAWYRVQDVYPWIECKDMWFVSTLAEDVMCGAVSGIPLSSNEDEAVELAVEHLGLRGRMEEELVRALAERRGGMVGVEEG